MLLVGSFTHIFYKALSIASPSTLQSLLRTLKDRQDLCASVRSVHIRIDVVSSQSPLFQPIHNHLGDFENVSMVTREYHDCVASLLRLVVDSVKSIVLWGCFLSFEFHATLNTLAFENVTELAAPLSVLYTMGSPFVQGRQFDDTFPTETTWPALRTLQTWLGGCYAGVDLESCQAVDIRHLTSLRRLSILFTLFDEVGVQHFLRVLRVPSLVEVVTVEMGRKCRKPRRFDFPFWFNLRSGFVFDPRLVFIMEADVFHMRIDELPVKLRVIGTNVMFSVELGVSYTWEDVVLKVREQSRFCQEFGLQFGHNVRSSLIHEASKFGGCSKKYLELFQLDG